MDEVGVDAIMAAHDAHITAHDEHHAATTDRAAAHFEQMVAEQAAEDAEHDDGTEPGGGH